MPWQEVSTMSLREEFVALASQEGANVRALCRQFGISPTTGYKWLGRYREQGAPGLADQSRRPHTSPARTAADVEAAVVALRQAHPAWGARKLHARLLALGHQAVPSPGTITAILRRHELLDPAAAARHRPRQRFEHVAPNALWQMDFKGHFATLQGRCHPLTILDDHSRFALAIEACPDEQATTVQARLTAIFRRYGLPARMLMDNGAPWGDARDQPHTILTVWLLRLGIAVSHGRPAHPQTQGKEERFHRTLQAEALRDRTFTDLADCQRQFDRFRDTYNLARPHQALDFATPASRYRPSPRPLPETLPPIDYAPGDLVRRVQGDGTISLHNRPYHVGKAFRGYPVALRPTTDAATLEVFFCHHRITTLDLRDPDAP